MLNIIQPDIWLSRKTRPSAAAIAPVEMSPSVQRRMAMTPMALIMTPLSSATEERTVVIARVSRTTAARKPLQPVADIGVLAPAAVEQLYRHDVGEGVDQAAVEDRALVGGLAAGAAHLRQQEADDPRIAGEPQRDDHAHQRIERHQDGDRQHHEGEERPHGLQHVDDEVADRLAALHDLGGDAAGEIVLVEIVGLLDDAPERLPAHHRIEARAR